MVHHHRRLNELGIARHSWMKEFRKSTVILSITSIKNLTNRRIELHGSDSLEVPV